MARWKISAEQVQKFTWLHIGTNINLPISNNIAGVTMIFKVIKLTRRGRYWSKNQIPPPPNGDFFSISKGQHWLLTSHTLFYSILASLCIYFTLLTSISPLFFVLPPVSFTVSSLLSFPFQYFPLKWSYIPQLRGRGDFPRYICTPVNMDNHAVLNAVSPYMGNHAEVR